MSSIELKNVSLDYLVKTGANSINKSGVHLINSCFEKSSPAQAPITNSSYRALNDINLQMKTGDRIGLLGRNGAGKSTFLKLLGHIYKPSLGEMNIKGSISNLFDVSSDMNIESTGYEHIINLATMRGISKKDALNMVEDVENFTQLGTFLNNPVKTYSTGMLLKLAFAVATSIPSDIILIDEIIGIGDIHFMDKATKRLEQMLERSHILVLASHSHDIIQQFCNKVLVLDKGQIQFFGDVVTGIEHYTSSSNHVTSKPKEEPVPVPNEDILSNIILSSPHLGQKEQVYVQEAFASNWIAPLGPNVDAFENEIAQYVGVKSALAVSSGTAAIHLALILLGVKAGDTVFASSFTFVATANPIIYQGAAPVFIDSDLDTWNMSPLALERALNDAQKNNKLPKAVIVVNLYGQSANLEALCRICDHYQVPLIEDAAESLGATYNKKPSGTFGKLGIYSFNGNKIITTSGGGMLISDDEDLIKRARYLATQAREPVAHYEHTEVGYNYRMSNVLAGIGRGQLQVLDERVRLRRSIFEHYQKAFQPYPFIQMMPEIPQGYSTRWLSTMTLNPEFTHLTPEAVINYLRGHRIEARRTWKPMHRQPVFAGTAYYPHTENLSVSDYLFEQGLCLPSGSNLNSQELERIVSCLDQLFSLESSEPNIRQPVSI